MADLHTVQALVADGVPFNRMLGLAVAAVSDNEVEVVLAGKPEYYNHVGTVHAGAQFVLGEATSGAMLAAAFSDLVSSGAVPLATRAGIIYRAPAVGDLRGRAWLADEEKSRIRQNLAEKGRARFTVVVQIVGSDEKVASELEVEWIMLAEKQG